MRLGHFPLPHISVFFLLLLLSGQLNFLCHARSVNREAKTSKSEEHSAPSMGYFPKKNPFQEHDDDFSPIYGVSKRLVPQGPNPLHNWSDSPFSRSSQDPILSIYVSAKYIPQFRILRLFPYFFPFEEERSSSCSLGNCRSINVFYCRVAKMISSFQSSPSSLK